MQGGALAKPPFASPRPLPLGLSSAALAEDVFESLRRQADSLWSANLPSLRFPTLHAEGLTAQPRDMRPLRLESGRALMAGRFTLAGVQLAVGPKGDPWSAVFPSERFEQEMHRFAWLPELMSVGPAGARVEPALGCACRCSGGAAAVSRPRGCSVRAAGATGRGSEFDPRAGLRSVVMFATDRAFVSCRRSSRAVAVGCACWRSG